MTFNWIKSAWKDSLKTYYKNSAQRIATSLQAGKVSLLDKVAALKKSYRSISPSGNTPA